MKTKLTPEQSAKLIELGVSPERASEIYIDAGEHGKFSISKATSMMLECAHEAKVITPIFTLADILDILPKEPKHDSIGRPFTLHIREYKGDWRVWYARDCADVMIGSGKHSPELIDALHWLLLWCLKEGHVK